MISLDESICSDFKQATSREWLETNGIGGFASGTVSGANTRRYHAILTAATRPPLGRITTVAKLDEKIVIDGEEFELSSNQYPGAVHPNGYKFLKSFRLDPFPIWTYELDGIEIEKKLFMVHGSNTTICRWSVRSGDSGEGKAVKLEIRPLLSFVDYHSLSHENGDFDDDYESSDDTITIRPYADLPPLFIRHNGIAVEKSGYWYNDFELAIEQERGFDHTEDLFQPFVVTFDLSAPADVVISCGDRHSGKPSKLERDELKRREKLIKRSEAEDEFEQQLVLAADQFIVERGSGYSIIAGYPWFSDWGRDTMIALNGLTLATGRPKIAKEILLEFSKHVSQGMLPNRFPDAGDEAEYNTVDATLWYFEAVRAYAEATGDHKWVKKHIYPTLVDIMAWHLRGTRYQIHVDTDGLLYAGEPGVQLTWMDAKIGDKVITPRTGKPVEIQALWYNALKIMADFAQRFGDEEDRSRYQSMADLAQLSFNAVFWNDAEQCLFDVVDNGHRDASVRPNQIFAVSLPYSMLDDEQARKIVDKVETELLTPVGLRSLAPSDPAYVPIYIGGPYERDSAYHQGTVWGWLIGPFVDAYCRVYPDRSDRIAEILSGFKEHLTEAGLGQISEIFDADPPHAPRGCPAQAWSVAEMLRVIRRTDEV